MSSVPTRLRFTGRLLAPGVIVLAAISIVPLVVLILMSFAEVRLVGGASLSFVGLDNWARIFSDAAFWRSWLTTIAYLVTTIGLQLVLGTAIALGLHQVTRGRGLLLSLLLLPMFVAPVIVGLLGRFLTDSSFGLYAWLLGQFGYEGEILAQGGSAFAAVVAMDVWNWTPLLALIVLAGLTSINPAVVEAARLDGASGWSMLRHITLPSIASVLLVGLLIRSMDAIRFFDIISITTNGGPADATKTAPVRLYETAFRFFDIGYAAVTGIFMLAVTIFIARGFIKVLGQGGTS